MPTVADQIVAYARSKLGDPYVWGAEGPNGFDCSGLVYAAYKAAGLPVSRTTAANLGRQGTAVSASSAQPGDVVYFDEPGTTDHVGIYIGGGQMIEAPTQGVPVRVASIRNPTSIRRLPGVQGPAKSSDFAGQSATATVEGGGPGVLDALNPLNLFRSWQNDVTTIALKAVAGVAVVGLAVVSVKAGISDRGQ